MTRKDTSELREYLVRELGRLDDGCAISAVESCADEGDLATQFNQHRLELAVAARQTAKRRELQHALERLDVGDFGSCDDCGGDIPLARLKANPTARLCVRCQEKADRRHELAA